MATDSAKEQKKEVKHGDQINRLKKIEGQVRGIIKMIEDDRHCIDILTQLKSVNNALHRVEENILKKHIESCLTEAIRSGDEESKNKKIDEVIKIISKF